MQPQVQAQPQDNVAANIVQDKVDPSQTQNRQQAKAVEPPKETEDQINWKKFREEREKDRKQAEESARKAQEKENEVQALKAAMDAILSKPTHNSSNDRQMNEEEETEDQKIEKKVLQALEVRDRQRIEQKKKHEAETLPQRLQADHKDFNQVCSTENLDYLDYHYPEVSRAFRHSPDSYDKWSDIYKAVKRFVPNTDSRKDQKKAEANYNKPQSMSIQNESQMGKSGSAHILDDAKKASNWERMQRAMKGLS